MLKRTEDQIVAKATFSVHLGEEKYEIKPLPILAQREWRGKFAEQIFPILNSFKGEELGTVMAKGLASALVQFPEKISELLFEYAPYLPKDRIMAEATEEQVAHAFSDVMVVAYPFLPQLATATRLWREVQPQQ